MTNRFITAALLSATLLASNSFAANAMPLSRDQVRAAYQQAKADGSLLPAGEVSAPDFKLLPSVRTRDEVRAEYLAAQKHGTLARNGEIGMVFAASGTPRDRQQVRAEAAAYARESRTMTKSD